MSRLRRCAAIGLCFAALFGCGKKGPPLAPIVRIPAEITTVTAQRVGNEFYVTLTVPTMNIDGTVPLDIGRIDVYGYTGTTPPPRGRFLEVATRVASVPVIPLPSTEPAPTAAAAATPEPALAGATPPPAVPVGPPAGPTPGSRVTIVDTLTPEQLVQGTVIAPVVRTPTAAAVAPEPRAALPLRRFYLALPFSTTGRAGPEPAATAIALVDPPPPPEALVATPTPQTVVLSWQPNGGIVGFLFGQPLPPEPNPTEDVFDETADQSATPPTVSGPVRYNVYVKETPVPGAVAPPVASDLPWQRTPGTPVNPVPLTMTTTTDPIVFGRERCYTVRAVRGTPPDTLESAASDPVCITPVDTYPPAVPAELVVVAAEGSISLIWEPGSDPDLGGYLVLRGAPGDATLRPLTPAPITEARYVDTMVTAGTRYVYAIVAVDSTMPTPNMSAESMRVEETAR